MRTIATYLIAIMVFVLVFYVGKLALTMIFGTLLKTAMLAAMALLVAALVAAWIVRR